MIVRYAATHVPVPWGTELGGYVARTGTSDGTLDPLEVQVLTVESAHGAWSLVVGDVVCVNRDLVMAIRSVDALADHTAWVHATHTHASPELGCVPAGTSTPSEWLDRIADASDCAAAARRLLGPARVWPARVWVDGIGGPRNEPIACPVPVDVLTFVDADDELLALIVVVPVHPTVLPASNRSVSADLPGAVRSALRAKLGCDAVLVTTGAAGDVSTRSVRRGHGAAELHRLGDLLADAVVAVVSRPARDVRPESGSVTTASVVAALPRKSSDAAERLHRVAREVRTTHRLTDRSQEVLRQAIVRPYHPGQQTSSLTAEVAGVRLGRHPLAGVPCEPFLQVGERLRARHGCTVLGYTNGYLGYLPGKTAALIPTYESLVSPFAADADDALARAVAAVSGHEVRR